MKLFFFACTALLWLLLPASAHCQDFDGWELTKEEDPMSNETTVVVASPRIDPLRPMGPPYESVRAQMGIECLSGEESVWFWFSDEPNLLNDRPGYGRFDISTQRVKFDDRKPKKINLHQNWGSQYLRVGYGPTFLRGAPSFIGKALKRAKNTILLELNWVGGGLVHFRFDVTGVPDAIDAMREACE